MDKKRRVSEGLVLLYEITATVLCDDLYEHIKA